MLDGNIKNAFLVDKREILCLIKSPKPRSVHSSRQLPYSVFFRPWSISTLKDFPVYIFPVGKKNGTHKLQRFLTSSYCFAFKIHKKTSAYYDKGPLSRINVCEIYYP